MALTDELVNRLTWKIPNALALIGSRSGTERNGMTASWISQLSMEPVLIGVSVENTAVTHRLISEGGVFTVNLWDAEQTRVFVKFSKPAAYADGTLNGRPVREATTGAPGLHRVDRLAGLRGASRAGPRHTHAVRGRVGGRRHQRRRYPGAASMSDTRMKYGGVKRH